MVRGKVREGEDERERGRNKSGREGGKEVNK